MKNVTLVQSILCVASNFLDWLIKAIVFYMLWCFICWLGSVRFSFTFHTFDVLSFYHYFCLYWNMHDRKWRRGWRRSSNSFKNRWNRKRSSNCSVKRWGRFAKRCCDATASRRSTEALSRSRGVAHRTNGNPSWKAWVSKSCNDIVTALNDAEFFTVWRHSRIVEPLLESHQHLCKSPLSTGFSQSTSVSH